jgi:hypothetical protein
MPDVQLSFTITSKIDFEKISRELHKVIGEGLRTLTMQAYEEWQNEAGRKLKTTRRRYQDSLHYTIKSETEAEITLYSKDKKTAWLVTSIERGVEGFSIREAVLKKAKLHTGRKMSDAQRRAMFSYLKRVGRLGFPPVPFTDVPFRTSGAAEQGTPNSYRRISKNTKTEAWKHPGFKPSGTGGPGPLLPAVIEYTEKTAQDVFGPLIARLSI